MNRFFRCLAAPVLALALGTLAPVTASAQSPALDKAQVEQIVKDYLLQNPEVIRDALVELDRRDKEAEATRVSAMVSDKDGILLNSRHQVVLGNPDGDVTMVEFFDYNCGYCKRAMADMERLLDEDPNLRVVLKEYPVLGQPSFEAAQIAIAVNALAPDRYREFHVAMLTMRGKADQASTLKVAEAMGLARDDLARAVTKDDVRANVEEVYDLADQLGISGTPSYVIGDAVIKGAYGYDTLKAAIQSMRKCGKANC